MKQADPALVERFQNDLDRLIAPQARVGIAVSGGPDSLALLLLAAAARPGAIQAATVDHGLRTANATEAAEVGQTCRALDIPHAILSVEWATRPTSNLQAGARDRRYALLGSWARDAGLAAVATAHHADDQAETLLMRLARGSGIAGLGGIRPVRELQQGVDLIRPVLGWQRSELHQVVTAAGLSAVNDPSNRDARFDRTAARELLTSIDWLQPKRIAASASHCRDADAALSWSTAQAWTERAERDGERLILCVEGLPREIKRRLLVTALGEFDVREPPGPDLSSALDRLDAGEITTLAGLKLEGGPKWRLSRAPPRASKAGLKH